MSAITDENQKGSLTRRVSEFSNGLGIFRRCRTDRESERRELLSLNNKQASILRMLNHPFIISSYLIKRKRIKAANNSSLIGIRRTPGLGTNYCALVARSSCRASRANWGAKIRRRGLETYSVIRTSLLAESIYVLLRGCRARSERIPFYLHFLWKYVLIPVRSCVIMWVCR